jgi:hypothetical protein
VQAGDVLAQWRRLLRNLVKEVLVNVARNSLVRYHINTMIHPPPASTYNILLRRTRRILSPKMSFSPGEKATFKPDETTQLDPTPTHTTAKDQVSGTAGSAKDNVKGSAGEKQQSEESALAQKIGDIISNALERIKPVTDMINKVIPSLSLPHHVLDL